MAIPTFEEWKEASSSTSPKSPSTSSPSKPSTSTPTIDKSSPGWTQRGYKSGKTGSSKSSPAKDFNSVINDPTSNVRNLFNRLTSPGLSKQPSGSDPYPGNFMDESMTPAQRAAANRAIQARNRLFRMFDTTIGYDIGNGYTEANEKNANALISYLGEEYDSFAQRFQQIENYVANGAFTPEDVDKYTSDLDQIMKDLNLSRKDVESEGWFGHEKFYDEFAAFGKELSDSLQGMSANKTAERDAAGAYFTNAESYERYANDVIQRYEEAVKAKEEAQKAMYSNRFGTVDKSDGLTNAQRSAKVRADYEAASQAVADLEEEYQYVSGVWNTVQGYRDYAYNEQMTDKYGGYSYDHIKTVIDTDLSGDTDWLKQHQYDIIDNAEKEKVIAQKEQELKELKAEKSKNTASRVANGAVLEDGMTAGSMGMLSDPLDEQIAQLERDIQTLRNNKYFSEQSEMFDYATESPSFEHFSEDMSGYNALWEEQGGNAPQANKAFSEITDEEKKIYSYYYNRYGKKVADQYLDYLQYKLNARQAQRITQESTEFAQDHEILASLVSIPENLISGAGYLDVLGQNINRAFSDDYKPIDYNTSAFNASRRSSTIRGTVAQEITDATGGAIELNEEDHPVLSKFLNGKSVGDIYQLGMSSLDSLAVAYLTPFGAAGTVFLGGSAATQGVLDALQKGATDSQALTMGTLNGLFEALFEYVSLDKLLRDPKGILIDFLTQAGVEGSEEAFTTIANSIGEIAVLKNRSNYAQNVKAYEEQGMSREEAEKQALIDLAVQVGWDAIGGAVMGGFTGAIKGGVNAVGTGIYNNSSYANSKELIDKAMQTPEGSAAYNMAADFKNSGKKITNKMASELIDAIDASDTAAVKNAVTEQLDTLGVTENVDEIADAVAKAAMNGNLSDAQSDLIDNNAAAQTILDELTTGNYSEERKGSSGWAEGIKTVNRKTGAQIRQIYREAAAKASQDIPDKIDMSVKVDGVDGKITGIQDGKAVVTAADGTKTQVESSQLTDEQSSFVDKVSTKYGQSASAVMAVMLNGNSDVSLRDTYNAVDAALTFAGSTSAAFDQGAEKFRAAMPSYANVLNDTQLKALWNIGKQLTETRKQKAHEKYGKAITFDSVKIGGTIFSGANMDNLDADTKGVIERCQVLAQASGGSLTFNFFHGGQAPYYGSHERGVININVDRVDTDGKSLINYTVAHELTHYIQYQLPKQYQKYKEFMIDHVTQAEGVTLEELINQKKARQSGLSNDGAIDEIVADGSEMMLQNTEIFEKLAAYDMSLAEKVKTFVSDFFRKLYSGLGAIHDEASVMSKYAAQQQKLWDAMLFNALTAEAENVVSEAEDAGLDVKTNKDGEPTIMENEDGSVIAYSRETWESGGRNQFKKALLNNGYTQEEVDNAVGQINDIVSFLNDIAKTNSRLEDALASNVTLDLKHGRAVLHTLLANGDYPVNFDLSTICKKRRSYQRVLNQLVTSGTFEQLTFNSGAIAKINEILRDNGFETACPACFVESKRMYIQKWAETFCEKWNAEVLKRNPNADGFNFASGKVNLTMDDIVRIDTELGTTKKVKLGQGNGQTRMGRLMDKSPTLQKTITVEDILTDVGLKKLRQLDQNIYGLLNSFYGVGAPKIAQEFEPYNSDAALMNSTYIKDITGKALSGYQKYLTAAAKELDLPTKNSEVKDLALRNYLLDIGGARMQSFSDFMIEEVLDKMQLYADLAARKLPMHEYTKEIAAARIYGLTGAKINMSVIHHIDPTLGKENAGLMRNANGEYYLQADDQEYADKTGARQQSIGYKDAVALMLDPRYSGNVGTIAIGFSDNHIEQMLNDRFIRQVIPYHKSGLAAIFAHLTNMDQAFNYTNTQTTTVKTFYDLDGNVAAKPSTNDAVFDTHFEYNKALRENGGDPRKAAQAYLDWCAEKHPVYSKGSGKNKKLLGYAVYNPKFSGVESSGKQIHKDFTTHPNYYKLLEDFNTLDCITEEVAPQGLLTMNYPGNKAFNANADSEVSDNTLTAEQLTAYEQALRGTGLYTDAEIDNYVATAQKSLKELIADELAARKTVYDAQDAKFDGVMEEINSAMLAEFKRGQAVEELDTESDVQMSVADVDYMNAVNSGDMETAQKMVDDAAKAAGYNSGILYHGTNAKFNVFDTSITTHGKTYGNGIYLTDNKSSAESFSDGNTMSLYAKLGNSLRVDLKNMSEVRKYLGKRSNAKVTYDDVRKYINGMVWNDKHMLRDHSNDVPAYDTVVIENSWDNSGDRFTEYVVFDKNNVKSADPVTYDDNGKVIPLSERFNDQESDIRFSMADVDGVIKNTSTGASGDETYFRMSYEVDGKTAATLDYGDYNGKPNVKMVEVKNGYKRKGIATKLFQELQNRYPGVEINFGMLTEDGGKLLKSITYDERNESVIADRNKLNKLKSELDMLQKQLDSLYDIENPTDAQIKSMQTIGDRWEEVYNSIHQMEKALSGKRDKKTFVKTDTTQFSLADVNKTELAKKLAESEKARAKLEAALVRAKKDVEHYKTEKEVRSTKSARPDDVRKFAKAIISQYEYTDVKAKDIEERIQQIADGFMNEADSSELYKMAYDIATEIIDNSYVRLDIDGEMHPLKDGLTFSDSLKDIMKGRIYVAPQDRADIAMQLGYDNFEKLRKEYMGKGIYFTKDPANISRSLDTVYQELHDNFEGMFPEQTNAAAQMEILNDYLTDEVINPYLDDKSQLANEIAAADVDFVAALANDILDGAIGEDVRQYYTAMEREKLAAQERQHKAVQKTIDKKNAKYEKLKADKDAEINRIRANNRESYFKLRNEKNEKIKQIKAEGVAKRRALVKRYKENREKREIRDKIYQMKFKADQMVNRPNKTSYVPPNLMRAVSEMCSILTSSMERGLDARQARLDQRLADAGIEIDSYTEKSKKIKESAEKLGNLQDAYYNISKDETYNYMYSEALNGMLTNLRSYLAGTHLYDGDLSVDDLSQIYNMMNAVMYTVTNANKATALETEQNLREFAERFMGNLNEANAKTGLHKTLEDTAIWQMRPDTFFKYICGFSKDNAGEAIQKMFTKGTERKLNMQRDFYNIFQKITETPNENKKKQLDRMTKEPLKDKVYWGLKDEDGNDVATSRGMMLQAYMLLSQEDSFKSLRIGGFRIANDKEYYSGNLSGAFGIGSVLSQNRVHDYASLNKQIRELRAQRTDENAEQLDPKINELLDQAEGILGEAESVLNDMMYRMRSQFTELDYEILQAAREWYDYSGQKLDEVNLSMYGFKKKRPANYTPIHRDLTSVQSVDIRSIQDTVNLENFGSNKDRVKSTSPILLTDIFFELDSNQKKMSNFYGYVQVQNDFNKVYKMKVGSQTIEGKIARKFGNANKGFTVSGTQYVENYVRSVAGGAQEMSVFGGLVSNTAQATLTLNPRVALSQLASIPTAAAVLGWDNVAKGFMSGMKIAFSTTAKNQLAQDNVWFWQRYRGEGGMREIADMKSNRGNAVARMWNQIADTKVGGMLFNWCQNMDVLATSSMWAMSQEAAKKQGYDINSEEGKAKVNEIYTDTIRKTQPNYTATERSDLLRDHREGMRILTMYKTQSNQNLNILMESLGEMQRMKRDFRNGVKGVTQADVDAANRNFANSATAVVFGGTVAFAALRFAASLAIGALGNYRDDDDELTTKSITAGLMKDIGSSMTGMFALSGNLYDFFYSLASGESYYGISDTAVSSIATVMKNTQNLIATAINEDKDISWKDIDKEITSLCNIMGIPYANAKKLVGGLQMWFYDAKNGTLGQFEGNIQRSDAQNMSRFMKAYAIGDEKKMASVYQTLLDSQDGKTDWKRQQQMEKKFKSMAFKLFTEEKTMDADATREFLLTYGGVPERDVDSVIAEWQGVIDYGYNTDEAAKAYVGGDITADDYRIYLKEVKEYDDDKIESAILNLDCEKETGYAFNDLDNAYIDGAITADEAVKLRMQYADEEKAEAEKVVAKWHFEKETGYPWSSVHEAFAKGKVSEAKLKDYYQLIYDNTEEDAAIYVEIAKWKRDVPGAENFTKEQYSNYVKGEKYLTAANVSRTMFAEVAYAYHNSPDLASDKDSNGNTITNSKMKKVLAYINTLNISSDKKTALALSFYTEKNVKKYKLW